MEEKNNNKNTDTTIHVMHHTPAHAVCYLRELLISTENLFATSDGQYSNMDCLGF